MIAALLKGSGASLSSHRGGGRMIFENYRPWKGDQIMQNPLIESPMNHYVSETVRTRRFERRRSEQFVQYRFVRVLQSNHVDGWHTNEKKVPERSSVVSVIEKSFRTFSAFLDCSADTTDDSSTGEGTLKKRQLWLMICETG